MFMEAGVATTQYIKNIGLVVKKVRELLRRASTLYTPLYTSYITGWM